MRRHIGALVSVLAAVALSGAAVAADQKPRQDGCIGQNCGKDGPPPKAKPRQDGCIGVNCGKDGPAPKPKERNDGCIGPNCGPDKKK